MINETGGRGTCSSLPGCRYLVALLSAVAFCITLAQHAAAAKRPEFRLTKPVELPAIGLKIEVMPESGQFPLAPPSLFTYEFHQGDRTWKSELYSPYDLWRQTQQAGCWEDEHSNRVILASITLPLPRTFPRAHVTQEEFDKKVAEIRKATETWDPDSLAQWVADFLQTPATTAQPILKHTFNIQDLYSFTFDTPRHEWLAYVFRLNRVAAGQSKAPSTWFFAVFSLNSGINRDAARTTIAQDFFGKVTSCSQTIRPPRSMPALSVQSSPSTLAKATKSPDFQASREQVANSIKNLKDWWFAETDNYIILSDLTGRQRPAVKDVQDNIELLRSAYEQFIPPLNEIKAVSVVRMFAAADQYKTYVGPKYAWSSGLWMPEKRELVICPFELGDSKTQRSAFLQTVFHEAFHQYLFYALDEIPTSPWFNEGHAVFFQYAKINERKLEVHENEMMANMLTSISPAKVNIQRLLHLSYEQFYAKDKKALESNYVLAWALVYYLRKGAPLERPSSYAQVLEEYLRAVISTRDMNQATDMAFEGIPPARFQADFVAFWQSKSKRTAATQNNIFKEYGLAAPH